MAKTKKKPNKPKPAATPSPETTKQQLLVAARKLFAAHGFDGTTVKQICDLAGVNVSLISYHFQGKEGLYRACIHEFGVGQLEMAQRILQPPNSPEECRLRMQMFIEEKLTWMLQNSECCQMVQREADLGLPIAEDVFSSTFLETFSVLRKFINASQKQGFFRADFDVELASGLIIGALVHMIRSDRLGEKFFDRTLKDPLYQKKVKEQFVSIFMDGLIL